MTQSQNHSMASFVPQRHHWIDFGRAPRRDIAREQRRTDQQSRDTAKSHGVERAQAKQQVGRPGIAGDGCRQNMGRGYRTSQPQNDAKGYEQASAPEYKLEYVEALGPQRHSDADLACPQAHRVGYDAINSR